MSCSFFFVGIFIFCIPQQNTHSQKFCAFWLFHFASVVKIAKNISFCYCCWVPLQNNLYVSLLNVRGFCTLDKLIITVFTEINHIPLLRRVLTAASLGCKVPKNKELRMTKCVTLFGVYYKFNIKEVAKSMFSYFTDHIKAK